MNNRGSLKGKNQGISNPRSHFLAYSRSRLESPTHPKSEERISNFPDQMPMTIYYILYIISIIYPIYRIFWTRSVSEPRMAQLIWGGCLFIVISGTLVTIWTIRTASDFPATTSSAMLIVFAGVIWGCVGALLHLVAWIYQHLISHVNGYGRKKK